MKQLLPVFCLLCLSANAQQKFTVYFDTGEVQATASSVNEFKSWLTSNPDIAIETINGYADKTGKPDFNMQLSENRAAYVYGLLKAAGVNIDYAVKNAFGEQQASGYNHAPDRKVEISFVKAEYSKPLQPETELSKEIDNAKVGSVILLKNLNFYGGSTYVLQESKPVLKELLNIMLTHPKLKIDIQGHICCEIEDFGDLSGKRAQAIEYYLVNNGIDGKRVTTRGYGGHRPIHKIPERNKNEMSDNRRVEIQIVSN